MLSNTLIEFWVKVGFNKKEPPFEGLFDRVITILG